MRIHIKNGRVVDPKQGIDVVQDVFIAKGKIVAIGTPPNEFQANRVIDAQSLVVCPGLVDLSVRLRERPWNPKWPLPLQEALQVLRAHPIPIHRWMNQVW